MKKKILGLLVGMLLLFVSSVQAEEQKVRVNLFWSEGCPHCRAEKDYLAELVGKYDWLEVGEFEISKNPINAKLFTTIATEMNANASSVPFTIVCGEYFVGFSDVDSFKQNFENLLFSKKEGECVNMVGEYVADDAVSFLQPSRDVDQEEVLENESVDKSGEERGLVMIESVNVPMVGEVQLRTLSLPMLTFVIALLDGFNPCAMWVLVFLISLLLGMHDRAKMWTLGGLFIFTSGLVYFLFLAAWLNLFLLLGFIFWVRLLIGIFAIGIGGYYLRDYQINKAGACKVGGGEQKKRVFERLREITLNKNFAVSVVGIILLAIAVNAVELVCSAGLPAIYTQMLSITPMARLEYYLYLVFYIVIFMLDDMVVFGIAMTTLHAVGISGKYSRFSHLIGGIIMLIIGVLMLFKPELLMFG